MVLNGLARTRNALPEARPDARCRRRAPPRPLAFERVEGTTSIQSSERSLFGRSSSGRLRHVKLRYVVTIEREGDGRFIASVPEAPGCHVYGRTRRQAVDRARRALQFYVDSLRDQGKKPAIVTGGRPDRSCRRAAAGSRASCTSGPGRTSEGRFPRDPPTWKSSVPHDQDGRTWSSPFMTPNESDQASQNITQGRSHHIAAVPSTAVACERWGGRVGCGLASRPGHS